MANANFWIIPIAALIPMILGFVWYHEKVFGKTWMAVAGMTKEKIESGNMAVIFGTAYVLSNLMAMTLYFMVIHQSGVFQTFEGLEGFMVEGTAVNNEYMDLMAKYGGRHRSFSHGILHGLMAGIMFAFPVIANNALFERKGFKYILVNGGYWIVCATLMGGVLCHFG